MTQVEPPTSIPSYKALAIANAEMALAMYTLDIRLYRIRIQLEPEGWHVEYRVKVPLLAEPGPHYVVSADTGEIVSKKYYQ